MSTNRRTTRRGTSNKKVSRNCGRPFALGSLNTFSSGAPTIGQVRVYSWRRTILPYTKSTQIYSCPSNSSNAIRADDSFQPYLDAEVVAGRMQANPPIIFRSYAANAANYGIGGRAPMEYGQAKSLAALPDVTRTILITESKEGDNNVHMNEAATRFLSDADTFPGHLGTVVFAFADGHDKAMRPTATGIPTNMWNIEEENNPPAAGDFGGTYDDLLARLTNWDTLCKSKS